MGFNPTFYAGRPKLSEVTIDSDLDMGGRDILRARIGSPYRPETWPTEELGWGDVDPTVPIPAPVGTSYYASAGDVTIYTFTAPSGGARKWDLHLVTELTGSPATMNCRIDVYVDGNIVANKSFVTGNDVDLSFFAEPGLVVVIKIASITASKTGKISAGTTLTNTGVYSGAKTFNLAGKWLALGLDMQGLAATVKIQGVDVPYSDYAKYFPLAPSELTFPGNWDASQIRPIVDVYS